MKMQKVLLGMAAILLSMQAHSTIIQYTDFSDFSSTTTTSDSGAAIDGSANFTENGFFAVNAGTEDGLGSSCCGPMQFTGISAFEVGMIFGNDQVAGNGSAFFDAILSVFSGASLLGSVTVASNGNDLSDQFIGLGSDIAFDRVELQYSAASGTALARFITRIDLGYDQVSIPEPATVALFGLGLVGLGLSRRRRRSI